MKNKGFTYEIGHVFKNRESHIIITDRKYQICNGRNIKWYKYTCNNCGWTEGWIRESGLKLGRSCSCCCGRTAILGINTIWDIAPWMIDLGVDKEEAKKFTKSSNKKIKCKCPYCYNTFNKRINDIYKRKSIACNCGDGFSYPEKFIYSILKQLNIEFQTQLSKSTFEWCDKYRYDFYIPSLNIIIETHGNQHYEEYGVGRSLAEEQKNDRVKKELALANGVDYENYIVLDCRYSKFEFIKNSILESKLYTIFNLGSNIDWMECEKYALRNIAKDICLYWNNKDENETTTDLSKVFGIGAMTIVKYLKQGTLLKWCVYDAKEELKKNGTRRGKSTSKEVEMYDSKGNLIGVFESCAELERVGKELFGVHLYNSCISRVCSGELIQHKGFTFKYLTDI